MSKDSAELPPNPTEDSFHRKTLARTEVGCFQVVETAYLNGLRKPPHRHSIPCFAFTLRGTSIVQTYKGDALECGAGTLVFHAPDELHSDTFLAPEVRVLQINIESLRPEILDRSLCLLPTSRNLAQPAVTCLVSRLHTELRQLDELSPLTIEGLALELLANLLRVTMHSSEQKTPPWLHRVEELLRDRFAESLRLDAIAEEAGVHPAHLARSFHKHYGCTVGNKVRQLRIEYASYQILHSNLSLSEIALAAGFADQSHLARTFRKFTGMTPLQFANACGRANTVPKG